MAEISGKKELENNAGSDWPVIEKREGVMMMFSGFLKSYSLLL